MITKTFRQKWYFKEDVLDESSGVNTIESGDVDNNGKIKKDLLTARVAARNAANQLRYELLEKDKKNKISRPNTPENRLQTDESELKVSNQENLGIPSNNKMQEAILEVRTAAIKAYDRLTKKPAADVYDPELSKQWIASNYLIPERVISDENGATTFKETPESESRLEAYTRARDQQIST